MGNANFSYIGVQYTHSFTSCSQLLSENWAMGRMELLGHRQSGPESQQYLFYVP